MGTIFTETEPLGPFNETEPLGPFNDASVRVEADEVCCGIDSESSIRTKNSQNGCDDGFVALKY